MIKVGVSGACGKMGKRIICLSREDKDIEVILGLEHKACPSVGQVIDGVQITADLDRLRECDCWIDFSAASATQKNLEAIIKYNKCVIIGTTGLDAAVRDEIKAASSKIAVIFSPNMSIGVNVLFKLIKEAAGTLSKYGVSISEAHHIHKKDTPSGTAKKIAEIINDQGFNLKIEDIKAIRENEIIGDHKIVFESDVDRIELFHSAKTRDIFVQGAILAAKWIVGKPAGLYSMEDVLFGNE
ncbi:MAG: 4-hydroxy-tetrahydrodipicolinate reductase [Candidatus Omnitrophota bacterium]|nr:4-hydroxy-tetrahydrodipicolinate reductase [Candidatus Omnitrophota bacterium]